MSEVLVRPREQYVRESLEACKAAELSLLTTLGSLQTELADVRQMNSIYVGQNFRYRMLNVLAFGIVLTGFWFGNAQ